MLEFALIFSNQLINKTRLLDNHITESYKSRSILKDINEVNQLFFHPQAVLLYKVKYVYQGRTVYHDVKNSSFTGLVGYIVSEKLHHYNEIVSELHSLLKNSQDRSWLENCLGEFIIIHYDKDKIEVIPSNAGTHLIYYRQSEFEVLISNRLSLTNLSFTQFIPKIDIDSQLQIIAYDSIFNDKTTFKDSKCLERGYYLNINFEHNRPRIEKIINKNFLGTEYILDSKKALDQIIENTNWLKGMLELFNEQVYFTKGLNFFLSGGKDSRVLLSLFVKSGFIENFKQVITYGSPGDADVEAAKLIASFYNKKHEILPRGIAKNIFFERLPYHVYHMEGEINSRILSGNYLGTRGAEFTGHEVGLREAFVDPLSIKTEKDLFFYIDNRLPIDPIGFISIEYTNQLKNDVKKIYDKSSPFKINPENFLNYFSIIGRGPRWVGKITSMNSAAGLYINLLINSPLNKTAHRIGVYNREMHLIHLGMLLALDKDILKIPFAKQSWPMETLKRFGSLYKLPTYQIEDDVKNSQFNPYGNNWWEAIYDKDNGQFIKYVLHSLRHKELDKYLDYNILNYYIDNAKKVSGRAMLSIYAIISASLLLHAKDITDSSLKEMDFIVKDILKTGKHYPVNENKSLNVIRLPIKNIIYKSFFNQYPYGSNKIKLTTLSIANQVYEALFIHSGNEVLISLPYSCQYSFMVKCLLMPNVLDKCMKQKFEIIDCDSSTPLFEYNYQPNDVNIMDNEKQVFFNGRNLKFKVSSDISSQYGWCLFVISNVKYNDEV